MLFIFIVVLQSPAENFSFTQFNKFSRDLKGNSVMDLISTMSTKLYYCVINQVILYWPS